MACSRSPDSDFFTDPVVTGGQGGAHDGPQSAGGALAGGAGGDGASGAGAGSPSVGGVAGAAPASAGAGGNGVITEGGSGGAAVAIECAEELRFEGRCYTPVEAEVDWATAKAGCEALGAHLVTIGSEEENAFVWSILEDEVWIGSTDGQGPLEDEPGTYTWVTGEPMAYDNWTEGQPNAVGTDCPGEELCFEHCAFLWQGGEWNDRYCGHEIPYVCEWD